MTTATQTLAHDGRVLGLIGAGHLLSHFYQYTFPALILYWSVEMGVSYAALGLVMTLFALSTGIAQMPAGMLVDRYGARPVLVIGLLITAGAMAYMSRSDGMEMIYVLAVIAGVGNSVFHPADYVILNSSIDPSRMGKAFSLHTFSGHLGSAFAPATIIFLATLQDWRFALLTTGLLGVAVALVVLLQGGILQDDQVAKKAKAEDGKKRNDGTGLGASFRLMMSKNMLLFFLFFMFASLSSGGVQSMSVVALVDLHGIDQISAGTALTFFLFASATGILLGGVAADKFDRHDRIAGGCFGVSALIFAGVATWILPAAVIIFVFTIAGLAQGMIRPARDMMVRAVAPKGAAGRAFAFTSMGIAFGSGVAPVFFGYLVDQGASNWLFWLLVGFNIIAIGTILGQGDISAKSEAKKAEG